MELANGALIMVMIVRGWRVPSGETVVALMTCV